jgi:hypothetical protein
VPKPTPAPPKEAEELLNKDYDYLEKLDAKGWFEELTTLRKLSVDHELGLHKEDPNIFITPSGNVAQLGVRMVQVIEPSDAGFWLPRERLPALIVNLNATDEDIIAAVKRTLEERKPVGAPVRKPGRHAPNACFDKCTFEKWRNNQIVQLAYLLAWRAGLDAGDAKNYPDHVLGKWMTEPKDTSEAKKDLTEPKDTSEAKTVLKEALASLSALFAQIGAAESKVFPPI